MASAHDEGSTPAAWTTVAILLVATVVGALGVVLGNWVLFWAGGGGLIVVALVVGKIMSVQAAKRSGTKASAKGEATEEKAEATA